MKETLRKVLIGVIAVFVLIWLVYTGITDLTNQSNLKKVTIEAATNIYTVEHSINGIIPTKTEYFYIGIEKGTNNAYIIKASKKWMTGNFGSDGRSVNPNGYEINAKMERITNYRVEDRLAERVQKLKGANFPFGTGYCINLNYKMQAIMKLILAALGVILVVSGCYIVENSDRINKIEAYGFVLLLLVTCILGFRIR